MDDLKNKRVTVCGLGRFGGGIAVARWLVAQGARVLVTDVAKPEALEESVAQLAGLPIEFVLGEHRDQDFASADLVVASPAVPPANKYLQTARAVGVPITTEIRLFIERCGGLIVGVTGTKGKSTTAALLGRMLERKHVTHVGGNIGVSLLDTLPEIRGDHLVVLELSSFMLEYLEETRWSPHVALVTMVGVDHLERHLTEEKYWDAKKNVVRFQKSDDYAVLSEECPLSSSFAAATPAHVILYGTERRKPFELKLPGQHNQLNAQGAFAAASLLDISWDDAQAAVREFVGLRHRLELVHEHCGVRYVNDSIATIPEAAVAALDSFQTKHVIQIVGGYDKKLKLDAMYGPLVERAKAVLCIGDTGPAIANALEEHHKTGGAMIYRCGDLATAIRTARTIASAGDTVLLSTGCASYDAYHTFEERGDHFARLAREND